MRSLNRYPPLMAMLALLASQPHAAAIPRPEHPFPQAQRAEWLNLNGTWEFAETDESTDSTYLSDKTYPDKIIVPYCRESKLSGLARKGFVKNVWYRRTFELPKTWRSPRTILHIGACDWKTRVWLNGTLLGQHVGGSAPFSLEITKQLKPGKNTIIVSAYDDVRTGLQAGGKQSTQLESYGCSYTRTTGIWQTVWLEGVGSSYVRDTHIEPDPANSRVLVHTEIDGPSHGLDVVITARANGKVVGQAKTPADWRDTRAVVNLSTKRLWSVKDPFLYDLDIRLARGGKTVDSVASYFGLRSVTVEGAAILINGQPVFQRLILDQGFYPDGIWTAPTDTDLKKDIQLTQAMGCNGARLHQKVFEPRYLYWADKLGYLVWGEFPNWGLNYGDPKVNLPVVNEWGEILRRDRNHPSIVGWCPFNESADSASELQNTIVDLTRLIDPTRPVIDSSGWVHSVANPDVLDAHDYTQIPDIMRNTWCSSFSPNTSIPRQYGIQNRFPSRPFMVSEFGGIGWSIQGGWGYGQTPTSADEFYTRYAGLVNALLDSRFMFGFCYTQLTDVEQEQNGLYTYNRTPKFDAKRMHAITSRSAAYEKDPPLVLPKTTAAAWHVLVGAVPDKERAKEWRYTTDQPDATWTGSEYDDAAWKTGFGGFGRKPSARTLWDSADIWLRQEFTFDGTQFDSALLVIDHDEDAEVYVNGAKIWSAQGWNNDYEAFAVTNELRKTIRRGRNVIAIHCRQVFGGQYIDAALLVDK